MTFTNPAEPPVYPSLYRPRRFGCEGHPLSERLKTLFEARTGGTWNIYDTARLELVSQDEHLSMRVLSDVGIPSTPADRAVSG